MEVIGVITGDIVESGEIKPKSRKLLYSDLKDFLAKLKKEKWISEYELFRGDSFQCVQREKENVLRVAIMIRAFIKSYIPLEDQKDNSQKVESNVIQRGFFPGNQDIRLSIGIGQIDFYNKKSLAHSDGEAFRLAGEDLESLKKAAYRMALKTPNESFNQSIEPTILLLDAVLQKWTNNQAETVLYKLQNHKEEEISKIIKISQPAVNQRIRTAQWFAIEKLLVYFEKTIKAWS
ncbi:MAG: hypothetical protein ABR503_01400 [Chitinophagaceae bacterium]